MPPKNPSSDGAMGTGWSFRKVKNNHEAGLSRAGKKKKERQCHYVLVDVARQLFNPSKSAP
jgi:hypothetical protein